MNAHMGQYVREYRPHWNGNRIINTVLRVPRRAFSPSQAAVIVREKRFPDVSFYQGNIFWDRMYSTTDTVIIRAGQGTAEDPKFRTNWAEAKSRRMYRGCYWFYDDRKSPGAQADKLYELIRFDMPEMEIVIDWENTYGGQYGGLRNVVAMMEAVEAKIGLLKCTAMYTGFFWFVEHSNAVANASQYRYLAERPLWLGWYVADPAVVRIPAPWKSLLVWQYGTPAIGHDYGVQSAEIDMNFYNGTPAQFYARYGDETIPPPDGETMTTWYRINRDILNIREGPGTSYRDLGDLTFGDKIEVTAVPMGGWLPINRIWRSGSGAIETIPSAWCKDTYCVITDAPVIVPPPDPEPEPTEDYIVHHRADGTTKKYIPE
jgi:GH25 family lysozyme M1 (1,4-beta-N-acetylmuramidase)